MTSTKKTTSTDGTPTPQVVGRPLREGQRPERVIFSHHLRIGGRDFLPGDTAHLAPDYARQLRNSGYLARERA
ncbi:hypothetical protein ACQEVS_09800 [Streptomyces sp. CA-181903]|uniref:hypothetical protein n=1 Tax=Streptomyces sp. CA-181903 TaxID=3240055 RepID=UPI003D8EF1EB